MSAYIENKDLYERFKGEVLALCLIEAKVASYASEELSEGDFDDSYSRFIFTEIKSAVLAGKEVDYKSIAEKNPKAYEWLLTYVENTLATSSYEVYVQGLKSAKRRMDLWQMNQALAEMLSGNADLNEIEGMINLSLAGRERSVNSKPKSMAEIVPPWVEEFKQRCEQQSGLRGISTGYKDLDNMTTGFCDGNLITLAGRPAMGKSMAVLNLALEATKQDKNVLFISLEMTATEIADRLASNICQIDGRLIRNGVAGEAHQVKQRVLDKIAGGVKTMRDTKLHVIDGQDLTPDSLILAVQRFHREIGCDMVIIDYLGLLLTGKKPEVDELGEISRNHKMLATSLNIPVIQLHQVNRDCEKRSNRRPKMSDLRGSGKIEEHSNIVMFLYRNDAYVDDSSKHDNRIEFLIEKNRAGSTGTVELGYDFKYMKLTDNAVPNFREVA